MLTHLCICITSTGSNSGLSASLATKNASVYYKIFCHPVWQPLRVVYKTGLTDQMRLVQARPLVLSLSLAAVACSRDGLPSGLLR